MTTAGAPVDMTDLAPIELLPVARAQSYVIRIADELRRLDGEPLFLVHDGSSGTSSDFVVDARSAILEGKTSPDLPFFVLVRRLAEHGNTVRLWDAGNGATAHLSVQKTSSVDSFFAHVLGRFGDGARLRIA